MESVLAPVSKTSRIAGWIISGLLIAFFVLDSAGKIILEAHNVSGSAALGWPESKLRAIGITLMISTILYAFPKTSLIGAILLTGYMGGAIAVMARAGMPVYFSIVFAFLIWIGLALRDARIKRLFL